MFHICFCLEKHMLYIEWLNIYFSKLKIAARQHRDSVLVREDRRKTRFEKFRPQTGLDVWVDGPRLLTLIREWTWSLSQVFFFFTLQSFVKRRSRNSDQLEAPRRLQRSRVLEKVDVCSLLRSHTCFLGHLQGFSYHAGHVCSWRWRPCNANPPPRLRKVPCLPVQKENNKELSVAAAPASRPRCTSRTRPRVTACSHLSTHDSLLSPPPRFLSSSSTCERNMCVFGRSLDGMARRRRHVLHGHITAVTRCEILKPSATHGLHSVEN